MTSQWDRLYNQGYGSAYPDSWVVRWIARHFYDVPDRTKVRIVDLGCGAGAVVWYLAREGFDTYGVDGSPSAVDRARSAYFDSPQFVTDRDTDKHILGGDLLALPWPDATFDAAIDNCSITHLDFDETRRAVAEAYRVLKPGGRLFSVVFGAATTYASVFDKGLVRLFEMENIKAVYGDFVMAVNTLEWTVQDPPIRDARHGTITAGGYQEVVQLYLVEAVKR